MHAALLENNNNGRQAQPGFRADPRASAGRQRRAVDAPAESQQPWQGYDPADVVTASATFPRIPGEDPIAQAARLQRWIAEALPYVKAARERRDAVVFLTGAQLADAAAEERHSSEVEALNKQHASEIRAAEERHAALINNVRREAAVTAPAPIVGNARGRRSSGGGVGLFVGGLLVGGLIAASLLRKRNN